MSSTWVDRMRIISPSSYARAEVEDPSSLLEFNIVSLNILAESYLTPRSHPGLPEQYANVAFDTTKRRQLLLDTLERFCGPSRSDDDEDDASRKWDILALQELDLIENDDPILPAFEKWGYRVIRTTTDQRKDCCAIAYDVHKFTLVNYDIIRFDDLATLQQQQQDHQPTNLGGNKRIEKESAMMTYNNIKSCNNSNTTAPPELTGMVRSFLRRNCAIVAHLKSVLTNESIFVTSVHIYWHPAYEYVKLCQAKYLLDYVAAFAIAEQRKEAVKASTQTTTTTTATASTMTQVEIIPSVIICGDINSKPGSVVHKFFVESHVDARTVAPWRYFWDQDNEEMYTEEYDNNATCSAEKKREEEGRLAKLISQYEQESHNNNSIPISDEKICVINEISSDFNMLCGIIHDNSEDKANNKMQSATLEPMSMQVVDPLKILAKHCSPQDYEHTTPPVSVKYMLDYTLNRFTRWLRLLGIDARLESMEEEKERTSGGRIALFDHCKNEQRTLLTTSYKLLLRKECPPGAYLLEPKVGGSSQMELILPRLLRTHGVELTPCTFLTRCVLCNGDIKRISTDQEKRDVFIQHDAPCLLDSYENFEVFRCTNCGQGYWWDDRPSSSASRSFDQAKKLLQICLRGGVALKDENNTTDKKTNTEILGAFADFIDVATERTYQDLSATETYNLAVIDWLNEEKLSRPFKIKSVMAMGDTSDESIPFTTVTKEFVSTLDYIFYAEQQFELIGKLTLPTSFKEMNPAGIRRGHLIPSDIWPSDHIAVGARLRLKQQTYTPAIDSIYNFTERVAPSNAVEQWNSSNPGKPHPRTCSCGCIPQILSMFEMAELRKKAREEAKKAEAMTVK